MRQRIKGQPPHISGRGIPAPGRLQSVGQKQPGHEMPQVPWTRGEAFSFTPEARTYFRLSFMHMDGAEFEQGLGYLQRLLA